MESSRQNVDESNWWKFFPPTSIVIGPDRLVEDDVTRYGLHRRHVVRLGGLPDDSWLDLVPADARMVNGWRYMDGNDIGHLWICWKETK